MSLTPLRHHGARRTPSPLLPHDSYVTDGRRLFRVVPQLAAGAEHVEQVFASLEDCVTLEVQAYSPEQLHRMRLRLVRSADCGRV